MTGSLRLADGIAAVVVAISLGACSSASPAATATSTASPTATATSSGSASASAPSSSSAAAASASPTAVAGGLSFADGNALGTELAGAPTFLNGFVNPESGWTTSKDSDTTNGRYVYTSSDNLCTATLSQLRADGKSFTIVNGDDQASSTNALAWYFSNAPAIAEAVPAKSTDATLPYGVGWEPGAPGTDFRGVSAQTSDGGAIAAYARVFGKPGVALIAAIDCTTATGFAQHAQNALLDSGVLVQ